MKPKSGRIQGNPMFRKRGRLAIILILAVVNSSTVLSPDHIRAGALRDLKSSEITQVSDWMLSPDLLRDRWNQRTSLQMASSASIGVQSPSSQSGQAALSSVVEMSNTQLARLLARAKADDRLPEWLKRLDIGVRVGTGQPRIYAETTQPIWQASDFSQTFFAQGRATLLEGNGNYSGGLGYRKALLDNQLVLGVNSFYDYNSRYGHARLGGGAEILSPVGEFRWNIYQPTSNARRVEQTGTTQVFDTAVAGYDLELGAPVPYLPDLKLYGRHQKWDFKSGKDLVRDGARAEWYLTSFFRIDAESWYDSYVSGWAHRIGVVFRGDFDTTSRGFIFRGFTKNAYREWNKKDVRWITTYRVVREFDIITERSSRSAAGTVTINVGRGT